MKKILFLSLSLAAAAAPGVALAHAGALAHAHEGLLAGLVHPFTGVDHLAAMLAVGVWSALVVRPVWLAPLAFVALLTAGAVAALLGLQVPAVEPMIAASVLALGLLIALRRDLPLAAAALLSGAFAFFHGAAHGAELTGAAPALALAGMVLSTAALHLGGVGLGQWLARRRRALSTLAGSAVALLGAGLLLRLV